MDLKITAFVGKYVISEKRTKDALILHSMITVKEHFGYFQRKHSPTATGIQSKWIADGIGGGGAD